MTFPQINPEKILQSFENQRIMVVGDIMLDSYVSGAANRISPEAPVPILDFEDQFDRLGGAGNVALNIQALGATPILCGFVGKDADGQVLLNNLTSAGLQESGVLASIERMTTVKTRIMAGKQQLLRLDKEHKHGLSENETTEFLENTVWLMEKESVTGLIFQDYNKGVLTPYVIQSLSRAAKKRGIFISVDPKFKNFWEYQAADLFKPNLKEVRDILGGTLKIEASSLKAAAAQIRAKNQCGMALITLSEHGVFMDDGEIAHVIPTKRRNVADVCGAGDTVISVAALAIGAGLPSREIALLANLAGGQVVEKSGVVAVDKLLLLEELRQAALEGQIS